MTSNWYIKPPESPNGIVFRYYINPNAYANTPDEERIYSFYLNIIGLDLIQISKIFRDAKPNAIFAPFEFNDPLITKMNLNLYALKPFALVTSQIPQPPL